MALPLIIVPYRDPGDGSRAEHLRIFRSHLQSHGFQNPLLVVEQTKDDRKFNRGALLNIGATLATNATSFLFHDVDLLPSSELVEPYCMPANAAVCHFGSLWTSKYSFKTFFGGVLFMTRLAFKTINGFPNQCWGWGGEDDIVRNRITSLKIPLVDAFTIVPDGSGYTELDHEHQGHNPLLKNMHRWEDVEQWSNDLSDGLSNVRFTYSVVADGHIKVHIL
jgi:hypothetical protein